MKYVKYGNQNNLSTCFFNTVYKKNTLEKWMKGCTLPFPKIDNLKITKNYSSITLTTISAKVYKNLFLNHIRHEVKKTLGENQNDFQRNWSTSWGSTIVRIFLQAIWFYTVKINGTNTTSWEKETVTAIIILLLKTQKQWFSHWRNISNIWVYNLPGLHTTNINRSNKKNGFLLKKIRSR